MGVIRAIDQCQHRAPQPAKNQFADTLKRISRCCHSGSTVIIFSDFSSFDENVKSALKGFGRSLDVVAVKVIDPLEFQLPAPGNYSVVGYDAHQSKQRMSLSVGRRNSQQAYKEQFDQQYKMVRHEFTKNGAFFTGVTTNSSLISAATAIINRQAMDVAAL